MTSLAASPPQEARRALSWGHKIGRVLLLASGILFATACGGVPPAGKVPATPSPGIQVQSPATLEATSTGWVTVLPPISTPPPTETPPPTATPTPQPTATPTPEPTPMPLPPTATPEPTIGAPTSGGLPDLFWGPGNDPAPFGILIPEAKDVSNTKTSAVISGIIAKVYQQEMDFMGSRQPVWMVSIYLGNTDGEKIVGNFLFGRNSDQVMIAKLSGRRISQDPGYSSGTIDAQYTAAQDVAKMLKPGHQYAMEIVLSVLTPPPADCNQRPICNYLVNAYQYLPYNVQIYNIRQGRAAQLSGNGVIHYFYIPNL